MHNQGAVQIKSGERLLQDEGREVEVKFGNKNTNEKEGDMKVVYQSL